MVVQGRKKTYNAAVSKTAKTDLESPVSLKKKLHTRDLIMEIPFKWILVNRQISICRAISCQQLFYLKIST